MQEKFLEKQQKEKEEMEKLKRKEDDEARRAMMLYNYNKTNENKRQLYLQSKNQQSNISNFIGSGNINEKINQLEIMQKMQQDKKLEEERIKQEQERIRQEQERIRQVQERIRQEQERIRQEQERKRQEQERIRQEQERKKVILEQERINEFNQLLNRQKLARHDNYQFIYNFNNFNKEQKIKETIEDMCILGINLKNQIKQEKLINPGNFVPIQEAINYGQNDFNGMNGMNSMNGMLCLGVLAKYLEDNHIETAIERNPNYYDINKQEESSILLQFLCNGYMLKTKYEFHFDLGEERNNQLLYNKQEQVIFNNKLKRKLSFDYNIPEDKIIVTFPQKGRYKVHVIFLSEEFNNLNLNQFRNSIFYLSNPEFRELSYLKEIQTKIIMEGVKLSPNMLDSRGNQLPNGYGSGFRGKFPYNPPIGWKGFGLNVSGKYDNGNDDWLKMDGNLNEWAVAYHGIGINKNNVEQITNLIFTGGFKAGPRQGLENDDDIYHFGQKVGKGVFCSPNIKYAESYAGLSNTVINGKRYKMAFMLRVNPTKIRCSRRLPEEWVLDGTTNEMRPYRLLLKEVIY